MTYYVYSPIPAIQHLSSSTMTVLAIGDKDDPRKPSIVSLDLETDPVPSDCPSVIQDLPVRCLSCFAANLDGK